MKRSVPVESASRLIDEKIKVLGDWRGKTLAKVREIIHEADPEIVEGRERKGCQVRFFWGAVGASGCQGWSEFLRPLAGAMEHAEDFDSIIAHAVGDQVRGIGDDQLASALDAPGATQAGIPSKQFDGPRDRVDHAGSGGGIVEGDEGRLGTKVGESTL